MDDEEEIERKLNKLPSLLGESVKSELQKVLLLPGHIHDVIERIKKEIDDYKHDTEKIRSFNVLTFLHVLLDKLDYAHDYCKQASEIHDSNIITLTNKAWILLKEKKDYHEINTIIEKLDELSNNKAAVIVSKAEIAYAYSRLGINLYQLAVDCFGDVLSQAKTINETYPDNSNQNAWTENICIWTFGLALIENRRLVISNAHEPGKIDYSRKEHVKVFQLFQEVIELCDVVNYDQSITSVYKARSLVEQGLLLNIASQNKSLFPNSINDILLEPVNKEAIEDTKLLYFDNALKTCNYSDTHVLERSGKFYRYNGKIDKSIALLRDALKIKETSFAYHHLALSLKRKLEMELNWTIVSTRRGKGRAHGHSRGSQPEEQKRIRQMIKCPREVVSLESDRNREQINEIFDHLDQAVILSSTNNAAIYDKGLTYRQIQDNEMALTMFRDIITNKSKGCSPLIMSNSYEQAAWCLLELIAKLEQDASRVTKLEQDMKVYLKRSLEISCNLALKIPYLKNCWSAAPTLREFLEKGPETKQTLKELAEVHHKMKNFSDALVVRKKLLALPSDETENIEALTKYVEVLVEAGELDDAILAYDLIYCLPNGYTKIDRHLYISVHLDGGFNALMKEEFEIARLRFRNALEFVQSSSGTGHEQLSEAAVGPRLNVSNSIDESCEETGDKYDIFVLCSEHLEHQTGLALVRTFEEMGLSATVNQMDVLPGMTILYGQMAVIKASTHFLVMLDSSERMSRQMKMFLASIHTVLQERDKGNWVVVKHTSDIAMPSVLKGVHDVVIEPAWLQENAKWDNTSFRNAIKHVLTLLATSPRE